MSNSVVGSLLLVVVVVVDLCGHERRSMRVTCTCETATLLLVTNTLFFIHHLNIPTHTRIAAATRCSRQHDRQPAALC